MLVTQALREGLEREGGYRFLSDEWPYYIAGLVFRYMGVPMPEYVPRPPHLQLGIKTGSRVRALS